LVRAAFPDKPYVSLQDLDTRELANEDPRRFLRRYPDGAILDEVQRVPSLFSYLQTHVDEDGRVGLFVLTGSSQFDVLAGVSQSLAGRIALVPLLPFSLSELQAVEREPDSLEALFYSGLYPPIHDRQLDPGDWYGNYIGTYVERDVRNLLNVRDLSLFQRFLRFCAARTGQLVNASLLANDVGVNHNTITAWLSVLEASYIIHFLRPHHRNFEKRLVKTPKLYFHDVGLAAWLLGIRSAAALEAHPMRGALFETWAVSELLKGRYNLGKPSNLFFWKDRSGREVDVLIDTGKKLIAVEMKSAQTLASDFFRGLDSWVRISGDASAKPWLVYGGTERQSRAQVEVLPWISIDELVRAVAG
jgi:predicted AAA+ superfamily ATPase